MGPGQKRKRLLKLARRIPVEELRAWVHQRSPDSHSEYYIVRKHGMELLYCWPGNGEVTIEDDVVAVAISAYLTALGLVFDSEEDARAYGREHGLLERSEAGGRG